MKLLQSLFGETAPGDGLAPVRAALIAAEVVTHVGPWQHVAQIAVGTLTAVGFDRANESLLVTSNAGQSVIDATTGTQMYRNRQEDGLDVAALKATRLDHPATERLDMAGLYGGALPCTTSDGWSIDHIPDAWPRAHCILHRPKASIYALKEGWHKGVKDARFDVLARISTPIRAFGFSWTGRSLVLATPDSLTLWARPAPLHLA